jgi:hypothetical protein
MIGRSGEHARHVDAKPCGGQPRAQPQPVAVPFGRTMIVAPRLVARVVEAGGRRQLILGTVALLVARLALTIPRTGPLVVADEIGYLTNARVLAGGVRGQLSTAPFYHGGYSLLLAPLLALEHNPETSYRLVLVLNALLAASLAPLLYLLLTRCFLVRPRTAVWPALAASAYPSVTIFTQAAMSENLLFPLVTLWLLCFGCFLRAVTGRRRAVWAAGSAACAVWLWATHGSMLAVLALTGAAFLVLAVLRREDARPALLGLAIVALGIFAVHLLDSFLVARNYGGHAQNEIDQRLSSLASFAGAGAVLRNLVGQTWYLLVAPLGILGAAATSLRHGSLRVRHLSPPVLVLGLAVLASVGLLFESVLSFPSPDRPDMIVYGRYTEVVVPPLLAVALARLAAGRRVRIGVLVAALALATAAAALLRATVHPPGPANRWNVASLPAPTFDLGPAVLMIAGAVAVAVVVGAAVVRRRAPAVLAPLVLVLFLPFTAVAERSPVLQTQSYFYPAGWTSPAGAVDGARMVAFDTDHGGGIWLDQWFASNARFVLFSGASQRPPSRFVVSSPTWAAAHPKLRPKQLWSDPVHHSVLFRLGSVG